MRFVSTTFFVQFPNKLPTLRDYLYLILIPNEKRSLNCNPTKKMIHNLKLSERERRRSRKPANLRDCTSDHTDCHIRTLNQRSTARFTSETLKPTRERERESTIFRKVFGESGVVVARGDQLARSVEEGF